MQALDSKLDTRLAALTDTILKHTTAADQQSLLVQQRLSRLEGDVSASELRVEVAALRALSLGRNQFPPAPVAATIPSWQRASVPGAATATALTTANGNIAASRLQVLSSPLCL